MELGRKYTQHFGYWHGQCFWARKGRLLKNIFGSYCFLGKPILFCVRTFFFHLSTGVRHMAYYRRPTIPRNCWSASLRISAARWTGYLLGTNDHWPALFGMQLIDTWSLLVTTRGKEVLSARAGMAYRVCDGAKKRPPVCDNWRP